MTKEQENNEKEQKPATPEAATAAATPAAPASSSTPAPTASRSFHAEQAGGGGNRRGQHGGGRGGNDRGQGGGRGGNRSGRGRGRDDKQQSEFDSTIIDLARVTRVMAGGKRMSFRACVVLGDKKGRVGMGVQKGTDVQLAVSKATEQAKKHMFRVNIVAGTLPHWVEKKFKGAQVLLKPAKAGTGVIAGGPVRTVMELAGVANVVSKMKGSSNKINNVTAVIEALKELQTKEEIENITSK